MDVKDYLPLLIFLGLFLLTEILPTGNVTVLPIFSYQKFLDWYAKIINKYNPDGSIPNEDIWIDYYATNILKQ